MREDWPLIESSLAKQYGIRIRQHTDMPWDEFGTLVSGFMPDTPLGAIAGIRSETDPDTIKKFSKDQNRIHSEWRGKQAESMLQDPVVLQKTMDDLSNMIEGLFGGDVNA